MSQIWTICINCHLKLFTAAVLAFLTNYILSSFAFLDKSPNTHSDTHDTYIHVMHTISMASSFKTINNHLSCVDLYLILYNNLHMNILPLCLPCEFVIFAAFRR